MNTKYRQSWAVVRRVPLNLRLPTQLSVVIKRQPTNQLLFLDLDIMTDNTSYLYLNRHTIQWVCVLENRILRRDPDLVLILLKRYKLLN